MLPLFIDIGWLGSPIDVATFVLVAVILKSRLSMMAAGVVALAREHQAVDDDRLQEDLDVDEDSVESVQTTIVCSEEARNE